MAGNVGRDHVGMASEPGEKLELCPEGDGGFEQGRLCDQMCVLQQPFWEMCVGGAEARGKTMKSVVSLGPWAPAFSYTADNLFGLVLLMIRIRGAS